MRTDDLFRCDNHSSKYSKTIGMELAGKKTNRQAFEQVERLKLLFKSKFWSHRPSQEELQC